MSPFALWPSPFACVREQLLFKYQEDLQRAIQQYKDGCGGGPPKQLCPNESPSPVPVLIPSSVAPAEVESTEETIEVLLEGFGLLLSD